MKSHAKGFTLIELMIVVVIVAILAGIAYPSYRNQMLRSNRQEAKAALLQLQVAQEKHFLQNNVYVTTTGLMQVAPTAGAPGLGIGATTSGGHYTISLAANGAAPSYIATATAAGSQTNDGDCTTMTITQTGAKASANGGGSGTTGCW